MARIRPPQNLVTSLLPAECMGVFDDWIRNLLQDTDCALPEALESGLDQTGTAIIIERRAGIRTAQWDGENAALHESLRNAFSKWSRHRTPGSGIALEVVLATEPQELVLSRAEDWTQFTSSNRRGLAAYEFAIRSNGDTREVISPTMVIACNRAPEKFLSQFCGRHGIAPSAMRDGTSVKVVEYSTEQRLLNVSDGSIVRLFRGTRLIDESEVSWGAVVSLEKLLGDYLLNSVRADGRATYMYYPSRGEEDATRNNSIRQWMASLALCRLAKTRDSQRARHVARRNLNYNVTHSYEEEFGFGLIREGDKVKLGAVAVAAMALSELPETDPQLDVSAALHRTITHLWRDNGEFRTFYRPSYRNDQQNFYPGEALLAWAELDRSLGGDSTLRQRFLRSVEYYSNWHREHRNPAFVPWHTQACFAMWKATGNKTLRDFVFEMNDWLLSVQQWESAPCLDTRGRFYAPGKRFGPPHASSTGVYLEGLVDAYQMARQCCDQRRTAAYLQAIKRGVRSLLQLAFVDDTDTFYVHQKHRVRGGVRTTVYNNSLRIDNVQHNLLAILKILACMTKSEFEQDLSSGD